MNNQQDNQEMNVDISTPAARVASVGSKLREAREQLGLSVNDVANRIKFAPKQIEWLEADDFVRLPEAAFVRGFVRSYARLVELDPTVLLASLPSSHVQTAAAPAIKSMEVAMPTAFSARRHNIVWLAAALVVALSLAIFERMHDRSPVKEESGKKMVTQPLELPIASAVSETALLADQDRKPEAMLQVPVQNTPGTTAIAAPQPEIKQAGRTPPVTAPGTSTVPALSASTKPAPVHASVSVAQPVPVQVPAQVKEKAPVATPATVPTPAPVKPLEKPKAPAIAPVAVSEPKEPETSKSDNSFSFSNFFKRNTAPAADTEPPEPEVTAITSTAKPVKAAAEAGAVEHSLRLEFDEDAWVEIKDGNGNALISKMHKAGSLVRVAGKSPLDVTIGNAKAVRLFDKGKKINLARYTTAEVAHIKLK